MRLLIDGWEIRSFRPDDVTTLVRYANNRNVSIQLRDRFPFPYTAGHATAWLDRVAKEEPAVDFAIASAMELIGGIGLEPQQDIHRQSAEIGYWLGEPYWGQGIATRAVVAFTRWAFAELDLIRICATVFESNPASARVLEKAGYSREGRLLRSVTKDGRIMDSWLYAAVRP